MKTKFFTFVQNNSGGKFEIDRDLHEYVIIEANNSKEANSIAESKGIYFDGCDRGIDCDCCGDRWYETSDSDSYDQPSIWGDVIEDNVVQSTFSFNKGECGRIHYLNGLVAVVRYSN